MRALFALGAAAIAVAMSLPTSAATASTTKGHWAGYWRTTGWGNLMLSQKGTKVTGTFSLHSGKMVGTIRGSKLTGTWRHTVASDRERGTFVVTLSKNGKTFQGHWVSKGKTKSKAIKAFRIT